MKITVLDGYALNPGDLSWEGLEQLGTVTVYDRTAKDETVERIGDAQVVLTNKTVLNDEIFQACPSIRYIGVLATGYNVVDTEAAKRHGILVTNVPSYSTRSVAQFVFALLLEICHHAGDHSASVHRGDWTNSRDFCYWNHPLIELDGKTMGIIGFGRIGREVARLAAAFGMNVLVHTPHPDFALETDSLRFAGLDELLAESDVLSLHCPLSPSTQGIINSETITKMKDGVILINTSRGPLIVESDLAGALNTGKVAFFGADVVSVEPIKADNPLLQAKNCILTPHIAWAPKEARVRLMKIATDNVSAFVAGDPANVVNP